MLAYIGLSARLFEPAVVSGAGSSGLDASADARLAARSATLSAIRCLDASEHTRLAARSATRSAIRCFDASADTRLATRSATLAVAAALTSEIEIDGDDAREAAIGGTRA
jgi:hypothetical protein